MDTIDSAAVLKWFSGKKLVAATAALAKLTEQVAQGFWSPGVSRSVRAALGKANVAEKTARAYNTLMARSDLPLYRYPNLCAAEHSMRFGVQRKVDLASALTEAVPMPLDQYNATLEFHAVACRWFWAMTPVWRALQRLDAVRPPPVVTYLDLSPTVTKTWEQIGAKKVEFCPSHYEERTVRLPPKWDEVKVTVLVLDWPEDTDHRASLFNHGLHSWTQCQACGHAIRNPFNWVPLLVTRADGSHASLWVGTDCSTKLLGVKVTGGAVIDGSPVVLGAAKVQV